MSLRTDSQDAWIFQPPMSLDMIKKADFAMGITEYIYSAIISNTDVVVHCRFAQVRQSNRLLV